MTVNATEPALLQGESGTEPRRVRWRPEVRDRISLPYAVVHPAAHEVQLAHIGEVPLESGEVIPDVSLAYQTWGTLNEHSDNAILIEHALTGNSHVARGTSAAEGWWDAIVGPGCAIDTDKYFVVAANMLGGCYGSTGPGSRRESTPAISGGQSEWGGSFPFITIRDSVSAEAKLAEHLGIHTWYAVIGGSLGGARALEWAVSFPEQVARVAVFASCAASTAEQIALAQTQVEAIRLDPYFRGGDYYPGPQPRGGLEIARKIAHISYRCEPELEQRFGRLLQEAPHEPSALGSGAPETMEPETLGKNSRYAVESYLDHQGRKLSERFDANSYLVLTQALMSHDIGRGRGGVRAALGRVSAQVLLAYVDSDRLYLPEQTRELERDFNAHGKDVPVLEITSQRGHDGFLTEIEQVAPSLRALLAS